VSSANSLYPLLKANNIDATTGAPNTTGSNAFKAGSGLFELDATSLNNYTGTARINQNRIQAHSGAIQPGSITGTFLPATSGTSWVSTGTTFTYSEVGGFRFLPWGVYDDGSFADVDRLKATPECRTDSRLGTTDDPQDPNGIDANGMYGCYFGGTTASGSLITSPYFARFTPDHFALLSGSISNRSDLSCSASSPSSFTYIGEPLIAKFTLVAQNSTNNTTANYTGSWAKLPISGAGNPLGLGAINSEVPRTPFPPCSTTPAHPCVIPTSATGSFVNGVAADIILPFSVFRAATPIGPYSLFDVGVAPVDDGVAINPFTLDTTNIIAASPGNHALIGRTDVRYGRLTLANANGSELLNLPIKMRTEYWKDGTGFITNIDDNCTTFKTSGMTLSNPLGGITGGSSGNMPISHIPSTPDVQFTAGTSSIILQKPTPISSKGSIDICLDLDIATNQLDTTCQTTIPVNMPWLQGKWNSSGSAYDDDPKARATFGVYKSGPVIYLRELY
jgi:MSHA biogenesis protein MshQ